MLAPHIHSITWGCFGDHVYSRIILPSCLDFPSSPCFMTLGLFLSSLWIFVLSAWIETVQFGLLINFSKYKKHQTRRKKENFSLNWSVIVYSVVSFCCTTKSISCVQICTNVQIYLVPFGPPSQPLIPPLWVLTEHWLSSVSDAVASRELAILHQVVYICQCNLPTPTQFHSLQQC